MIKIHDFFTLKLMNMKKYVLAIFITLLLSFSFQPANLYSGEKEKVVYILDYKGDNYTNDLIKKNKTAKFHLMVSLSLQIAIIDARKIYFNSS